MTIPAAISQHIHVTEREPGPWVECTWTAGLEWYRLNHDPKAPATSAEREALRVAGGGSDTSGASIADLRRGIIARYGYTPPAAISGFSVLWNAVNGRIAAVQGSMKAFGSTDHYSRFDPNFDGGHAVFIYRPLNEDRVWWCDPEAPVGTYQGEWMSKANLQKFVSAFAGQHLVGTIAQEVAMAQAAHTNETPVTIDVALGATLYDLDGKTPRAKLGAAMTARYSPFAVGTLQAIYVTTGGIRQTVLVTPVAGSIKPIVDTTPYSQAQYEANYNLGVSDGTGLEKNRLRKLLGL